jgi:predicted Zn-dependent protease with MMP-like domain
VTRQAFRALVAEAIDSIPPRFAERVRNLAIVIEDEPAPDLLDDLGIDPPDTLLGLYQGTPLPERRWDHGNDLPDRILLFQGPIEDEAEDEDADVVGVIGETLIHELGHYFGMTEDEIMAIEERYWLGEPEPEPEPEGGSDPP